MIQSLQTAVKAVSIPVAIFAANMGALRVIKDYQDSQSATTRIVYNGFRPMFETTWEDTDWKLRMPTTLGK